MAGLKSTLNKVYSGITGLLPSMKKDTTKLIILLLVVGLVVYFYNNMQLPKLGMASGRSKTGTTTSVEQGVKPVQTSPEEQYTKVQGIATDTHGLAPSCNGGDKVNPMDLLPKDKNSEWAKLNPHGSGELADVNLLKSGHHIGVNTVNNTMRNANLQIRSEPPNPQGHVGPWNQTTMEPDLQRKEL
jgi:hypothetical protein